MRIIRNNSIAKNKTKKSTKKPQNSSKNKSKPVVDVKKTSKDNKIDTKIESLYFDDESQEQAKREFFDKENTVELKNTIKNAATKTYAASKTLISNAKTKLLSTRDKIAMQSFKVNKKYVFSAVLISLGLIAAIAALGVVNSTNKLNDVSGVSTAQNTPELDFIEATIDESSVFVSKQKLSDSQMDDSGFLEKAASRAGTSSRFQTDKGEAHIGDNILSAPQVVVFKYEEFLYIVRAEKTHDTGSWTTYINSLP